MFGRSATWCLGVCTVSGLLASLAVADDAATPPSVTPAAADADASPPRGLQLQLGDDPALPLQPLRERTVTDRQRLDALAHFMAGELHLERGGAEEIAKGLRQLELSIELNPGAIDPYRLYLPAAVQANEHERAARYALLAAQHTTDGVQLVRGLLAVCVQRGDLKPAIELLRAALKLESLPERSFSRLILQRHLGQVLALDNQTVPAAEAYQALLSALKPDEPELSAEERKQLFGEQGNLYEDMGNVFLAAKLPELAVEAFDRSAQARPSGAGVHSFNLAQVFRQTGKPDRALEELDKYFSAQLSEKGRAPYQLLKDLLVELQREEELLPRLQKLAEADRHNKFLHHFLAAEYVARGELDRAEKIYSDMGGQTDPEAIVGLAAIYRRQGKYPAWLKSAGRAYAILQLGNERVRERLSSDYQELGDRFQHDLEDLATQPEQLEAVLKLGRSQSTGDDPQLDFEGACVLGRIAIAAKRSDDVATFYKYAIGMQNLPSPELYRELGSYFIDQKEYDRAEATFQEAASHPALSPIRHYFLSLVSVARELAGRIDEAIEAIEAARKLSPELSQFAVQEARIYYRARRWDDAIRVFESIVREYPGDAELVRDCQFSLSALYVQKGDFDAGEKILLAVLEQNPDHAQANNDLGYLWADRGKNLEQAREMITKALKAEPDNAAYLDSMGWVLYRLGEYEEAAKHLERAAALPRGEDPTIADHLGDCLEKLGRHEQAQEAWKRALKMEEEKPTPDPKLVESLRQKVGPTEPAAPAPAGGSTDQPDQ